MRVVADTNIVVSGLLWRGNPRRLLEAAREGTIDLFTSAALLAELEDVLSRAKFAQRLVSAGSLAICCRFRCRFSVDNDSPCLLQNACRPKPLASYSATNRSTSAWLRRRRVAGSCFPFILPLQHPLAAHNRWFGLTHTIDRLDQHIHSVFAAEIGGKLFHWLMPPGR